MTFKKRRGCHQNPVRRSQFAGDNALGQIKTPADRRVEPLTNQVDLTIIKMPVRTDGRIALQELGQQRHDVQAPENGAHAHLQGAGRLPFGAGEVGHGMLDGLEAAGHFAEKTLTRFGQGQSPGAALKQAHPQTRLQPGNVLAHRRGRQAQAPGRLGETADFGATHKALDAAESFHRRDSILLVYTDYSDYRLLSG
ncbi:hypothetical protein D3C76_778600 [compost metagenome]